MNEPQSRFAQYGPFAPFFQEGVRNYLFLGLAATLVMVLMMLGTDALIPAVIIGLLMLGGLIFRFVISPGAVIFFCGLYILEPLLFAGIPPRRSRYETDVLETALNPPVLLLCVTLLVYLFAQFRVYSLLSASIPPGRRQRLPGQTGPRRPIRRPGRHVRDEEFPSLFGAAFGFLIVGFVVAIILFSVGLEDDPFGGPSRRSRDAEWDRFVTVVWILGIGGVILGTIWGYIGRRQANPSQARRFLEDIAWQETRREQSRIQRWRVWFRNRSRRQSSNSSR